MKKLLAVSTAVLSVALLTGCGGDDSETETTASGSSTGSTTSTATDSTADREKSLRVAIENYTNAKFAGDFAATSAYLAPMCTDEDKGTMMLALGMVKDMAKGASIRIKEVRVEGDRGTIEEYELVNASDPLRRLMKQSDQENGDKMGWVYIEGEWYHEGACDGATASPEPTAEA